MSDWSVFLAAVAVALIAVVLIQRRRNSTRMTAGRLAAEAEFQRPRDFVQEREDARRLALGGEGRDWEDASVRGATLNPERGSSAAQK
jgi:hypothetical protein